MSKSYGPPKGPLFTKPQASPSIEAMIEHIRSNLLKTHGIRSSSEEYKVHHNREMITISLFKPGWPKPWEWYGVDLHYDPNDQESTNEENS